MMCTLTGETTNMEIYLFDSSATMKHTTNQTSFFFATHFMLIGVHVFMVVSHSCLIRSFFPWV